MSVFSFSSFCFKPVVGYWSDKEGFRIPYFVSITLAILGGILYVLASALPSSSSSISASRPTAAICGLFAARLFGGCGGTSNLCVVRYHKYYHQNTASTIVLNCGFVPFLLLCVLFFRLRRCKFRLGLCLQCTDRTSTSTNLGEFLIIDLSYFWHGARSRHQSPGGERESTPTITLWYYYSALEIR